MAFKSVAVFNYRNLVDAVINCEAHQVFLIGENGQGKTNFLESIYFLCYGSSFRTRKDREMMRIGQQSMSVKGETVTGGKNSIVIQLEDGKKKIYLNEKSISDRKQLIEELPCIVFNHDDIDFVSGPPERRRWFFNQTMSLYNSLFIDLLRRYAKIVTMRNRSIKDGRDDLLDVYDEQVASTGIEIQTRRAEAILQFNATFSPLFREISSLDEDIVITYFPSWRNADSVEQVLQALRKRRRTDFAFRTTTSGPHRDRVGFYVGGRDFSRIASTGQRRLMSLVLRVAQATFFSERTGREPLLLLDDVLLELDAPKRKSFVSMLPRYEQAFFTFLPDERYEKYLSGSTIMYNVEKGFLTKKGTS